jgi:hypothetical protein
MVYLGNVQIEPDKSKDNCPMKDDYWNHRLPEPIRTKRGVIGNQQKTKETRRRNIRGTAPQRINTRRIVPCRSILLSSLVSFSWFFSLIPCPTNAPKPKLLFATIVPNRCRRGYLRIGDDNSLGITNPAQRCAPITEGEFGSGANL